MLNKKENTPSANKNTGADKYSQKQQKRKKDAAKAKRDKMILMIGGGVLAVALVAFIISFPIRQWKLVNDPYIVVETEELTRVEYSYFYNSAKHKFINENATLLSQMGIDENTITQYQYTEDMTFDQYFNQQALQNILSHKGLKMKAEREGFEYDVTEDMANRKTTMEEVAVSGGVEMKDYMKYMYGSLATWERLENIMAEEYYVAAYFAQKKEECAPTEEEILAEYKANSINYDLVDYRLTVINNSLPDTDESGKKITYTDEQILKASEDAKKAAKEALETVAQDGEEHIGEAHSELSTVLADYLFFGTRKAGDTIILNDSVNKQLLVVAFENRYRDESRDHDVKLIISNAVNAETIMEDWKKGDATEARFDEFFTTYDTSGNEDGIYNGVSETFFGNDEIEEWLKGNRKEGDTLGVNMDNGHTYVLYYKNASEESWITTVRDTLHNGRISELMSDATSMIKMDYK